VARFLLRHRVDISLLSGQVSTHDLNNA